MKYAEHISDLIGGTPLVKLSSVTQGLSATILAKVEYLNPGGSVKDRIALKMVEAAEASGELRPGGTIVEPTSGNTGVGLALIAQRKGYRCVFVCPDKVSQDKQDVLTSYGAEVVVTPTAVAPDHPDSYYSVSDRLVTEIDGAWKPNQYANLNGPASHYETTGPELWADTDGRITHFVAGVGTGGTITGTGRYLREVSRGRPAQDGGEVHVVGADPAGSVYSGGDGRPYLVEGVGEDFWPSVYDPAVPHEIIAVTDAESFDMTRRLAREEGLLVGGSCGMAVVAALRLAQRLQDQDPQAAARAVIVVLLPDGGRGYLSKIFADSWMESHGFPVDHGTGDHHTGDGTRGHLDPASDRPATTVGDLLTGTDLADTRTDAAGTRTDPSGTGTTSPDGDRPGPDPAALPCVRPTATVRQALALMHRHGLSRLPVTTTEPPVKAGEVAGSVDERALVTALADGRLRPSDPVADHVGAPLPLLGVGAAVATAETVLRDADVALAMADGDPVGVVTRRDLLGFYTR